VTRRPTAAVCMQPGMRMGCIWRLTMNLALRPNPRANCCRRGRQAVRRDSRLRDGCGCHEIEEEAINGLSTCREPTMLIASPQKNSSLTLAAVVPNNFSPRWSRLLGQRFYSNIREYSALQNTRTVGIRWWSGIVRELSRYGGAFARTTGCARSH
jgi:hypothetical protein